jgi:uncharacterized membrane protein
MYMLIEVLGPLVCILTGGLLFQEYRHNSLVLAIAGFLVAGGSLFTIMELLSFHRQQVKEPLRTTGPNSNTHQSPPIDTNQPVPSHIQDSINENVYSFQVCNSTNYNTSLAVVSQMTNNSDVWTVAGWWDVSANSCKVIGRGTTNKTLYVMATVQNESRGWYGDATKQCVELPGPFETIIRPNYSCGANGRIVGFRQFDISEYDFTWRVTGEPSWSDEQRATLLCDQLAANPTDPRKPANILGVGYEYLKTQSKAAVEACSVASRVAPQEQRYRYQYARALQVNEPEKALEIHEELVRNGYPASYDNAGALLIRSRHDFEQAIMYFKEGVRHGDPDSMVSLANSIDLKYYVPPTDPSATRFTLLSMAADRGHVGAQDAIKELQQVQQQRTHDAEVLGQMLGTIFGGVVRHQ